MWLVPREKGGDVEYTISKSIRSSISPTSNVPHNFTLRTLMRWFNDASSALEALIRLDMDPSGTGLPPPISSASAAVQPAEKR